MVGRPKSMHSLAAAASDEWLHLHNSGKSRSSGSSNLMQEVGGGGRGGDWGGDGGIY